MPSLSQRETSGGRKVRCVDRVHYRRFTLIGPCSPCFVSLLAVGDTVSEDEVVCEIETDKVRSVDETPLKQWAATNNSFNN